jgi:N-methylhydantoinase B/oxoprolinase/acetone carboxylase alpha subunit
MSHRTLREKDDDRLTTETESGRPVARLPNSGAYGDPFGRDPKLVLTDVLDGFTTLEFAERDGTAKIGGLAA